MSQLWVTGSIGTWQSQAAKSGFMDAQYNVMLAGFMTDNDVSSAVAVKYNGTINGWQNTYPGQNNTVFNQMTQLKDGTYMAVGSATVSAANDLQNIWLVNIDGNGNKISDMLVGGDVQSSGIAIVATSDGGFIITGLQIHNNVASTLIAKYSSDKTLSWQKLQSDFVCFSINANADGTFVLSGRNLPGGFNFSPKAILMDGSGNIRMNTTFSQFSQYMLQSGDAIQTSDGNFVMVAKGVILKFAPAGTLVWSWMTSNGNFSSVAELANGNLVMSGSTVVSNEDQAYVVVTDNNGNNVIWDNSETAGQGGYSSIFIDPRADGGVVWTAGTVFVNVVNSIITYSAFHPVTTLAGKASAYALAQKQEKKQGAAA